MSRVVFSVLFTAIAFSLLSLNHANANPCVLENLARLSNNTARATTRSSTLIHSTNEFSILSGPQNISAASVRRAFLEQVGSPRGRRQVFIPGISERGSVRLGASENRALTEWAESALLEAQRRFPNQDLVIDHVAVGVNFRAADSLIHVDDSSTFIHASSTLADSGASTIVYTREGMEQIKNTAARLSEEHSRDIYYYAKGIDADGNLTVQFRMGAEPVGEMQIPNTQFAQPSSGETVLFNGHGMRQADSDAPLAFHSSPLPSQMSDDRVTFFLHIKPRGRE